LIKELFFREDGNGEDILQLDHYLV